MRKIILTFLAGGLSAAVFAAPEMVSTISFNPSRLGQYTYLKINKDINLKGGLRVSDQTNFNTPSSDTGELVFAASNGGAINITSPNNVTLEIPNLTTKSGANSGINIYMPNAVFQKSSTEVVPLVEMSGGNMTMGSTSATSTVTTLANTAGGMKVIAAETLQTTGTNTKISIAGLSSSELSANSSWSHGGMTLGTVTIPKPSIAFNNYCWKTMKGANGTLKVFAICTPTDSSDVVTNTATPTYAWIRTGSSMASVNSSTGSFSSASDVNDWMTEYQNQVTGQNEQRSGSDGASMWVGHNDLLSHMLEGTFGGQNVNQLCRDIFGVNLGQVVTAAPSGTCTTKNEKKVYVTSETSTFRRTVSCVEYTCK